MNWVLQHKVCIIGGIAFILVLGLISYAISRVSTSRSLSTPLSGHGGKSAGGFGISTDIPPASSDASSDSYRTRSFITIKSRTGNVEIVDFLHNGETGADPQNAELYYLAGSPGYCLQDGTCPGGYATTKFNITYDMSKYFFNIVILSEPLGDVRKQAELFLAERLGVPYGQLCTLNYYMGTINGVNEFYAGKNLGFSFCPGAVPLP